MRSLVSCYTEVRTLAGMVEYLKMLHMIARQNPEAARPLVMPVLLGDYIDFEALHEMYPDIEDDRFSEFEEKMKSELADEQAPFIVINADRIFTETRAVYAFLSVALSLTMKYKKDARIQGQPLLHLCHI